MAFWDLVESEGYRKPLEKAWEVAWEPFRPQKIVAEGDQAGKPQIRVGPELRALRRLLRAPSYVIPELRDREIDMFISLINRDYERKRLEAIWVKLRQTYQQEMEPQAHHDEPRPGALRDAVLDAMQSCPGAIGELLPVLLYWNFPKVSFEFLVDLTKNFGFKQSQRQQRIPYLTWYVDNAKHSERPVPSLQG